MRTPAHKEDCQAIERSLNEIQLAGGNLLSVLAGCVEAQAVMCPKVAKAIRSAAEMTLAIHARRQPASPLTQSAS